MWGLHEAICRHANYTAVCLYLHCALITAPPLAHHSLVRIVLLTRTAYYKPHSPPFVSPITPSLSPPSSQKQKALQLTGALLHFAFHLEKQQHCRHSLSSLCFPSLLNFHSSFLRPSISCEHPTLATSLTFQATFKSPRPPVRQPTNRFLIFLIIKSPQKPLIEYKCFHLTLLLMPQFPFAKSLVFTWM